MFQHKFEWDPSKAEQNFRAHGITFERAATVFRDPRALSEFDEEHSQDEDRWITLGLDLGQVAYWSFVIRIEKRLPQATEYG